MIPEVSSSTLLCPSNKKVSFDMGLQKFLKF